MADSKRKVIVFPTKNELSKAMAKYTADLSKEILKKRKVFTVVLSGGDLIDWLGDLLKDPYIDTIEWEKWHVFWVDERVCGWYHPDSNYKLAKDGFLSKVPIPKENIHAIDEKEAADGNAKLCTKLYEDCLKDLINKNIISKSQKTGLPEFDLQLLGMGPDGHMASLFPGFPQNKVEDKWVTHILDSPKLPLKRITFTLSVINSALYNLMAVCDAPQAEAVADILKDNDQTKPSAHLSAQVENVWYLDQAAASKLLEHPYKMELDF